MLFFLTVLKTRQVIFIFCLGSLLIACTGAKRYFKAAERLEKKGLVSDAAEYYLESLQRNPTFVDARMKLKEVGQKHVSGLASEFFRNYNTQQLESSLESFEKLKDFHAKAVALNVQLDYPKAYDEDYKQAVENYCEKNYQTAYLLVYQKKYREATPYIKRITKYNTAYKKTAQLDITAYCEPLYQSAISSLENKNYASALTSLSAIQSKTESYKDAQELLLLASEKQIKHFILVEPSNGPGQAETEIKEYLFTNFSSLVTQNQGQLRVINNTPFQSGTILNNFNNSSNIDLIQAIRKATGADYYYVFDIANRSVSYSGVNKTPNRGYQEVKTRKNDTLVITEYKAFDYNLVKIQRSFSYEFKYKIINANTNQIISTQSQNLRSTDAVEYQEFQSTFKGNINTLFPYNPQQTAPTAQFNPRGWRNLFSARSTLKTEEDLKKEVFSHNMNIFTTSISLMR